jgi:parallel beta-helix repeat protein
VLIFAGGGPALNNNVVQGNFIGTNSAGTAAVGNSGSGITVFGGEGTRIGGATSGAGNVISGNGADGIVLFGSTVGSHSTVQGNKIGTKPDGSLGNIGNFLHGITIQGPDSNTIGGTGGAGNVIAQSNLDGVHILDSVNNLIRGNVIQHNGGQGVHAESGPNTITGNLLFNDDEGVRVEPTATGIRLVTNQIFNSGGLGINLMGGSQAVTPNDPDDPDTGANNLQNFPVITSAVRHSSNGVTVVAGTLNSRPNRMYRIELYLATADPSGHGEGQVFITAQNVDTNSGGDATFSFSTAQLAPGQLITTTATAVAAGDTSEFSANAVIISQTP